MTEPDVPDTGPEADEVRAAELAFGLLEPAALEEALARTAGDPAFAAIVERWRAWAALTLAGREETPPPRVWEGIVRRLPANDGARATWRWQVATAAAASIALALGATLAFREREVPAPAPAPAPQAAPVRPLVAVLASAERSDVVAVSYDAASGSLTALPRQLATGGREAQLWVIPKGGKPTSAGLLSPAGRTSIMAEPRMAALMTPGATLAISLEPRGGSRTGSPTGPVILTGAIARS